MANRVTIVIDADGRAFIEGMGKTERGMDAVEKASSGTTRSLNSQWKSFIGTTATVVAAVYTMKKAMDFAEEAAKYRQIEAAFQNVAAAHGASARRIIEDLRRTSAETIATQELMQKAGMAMTLGIPAEALGQLMETARAAARIFGQSVQYMFESLTTGIGRQSKLWLDNLGILIDLDKAYKDYAEQRGRRVSQLTEEEKRQAFLNAALEAGKDIVRAVGVNGLTAAEKMERFRAKLEDLGIALKVHVLPLATGFVDILNRIIGTPLAVEDRVDELREKFEAEMELQVTMYRGLQAAQDNLAKGRRTWWGTRAGDESLAAKYKENIDASIKRTQDLVAQIEALEKALKAKKNAEKNRAEEVSEGYLKIEQRIAASVLATERLGASKERLIEVETWELFTAGATIEQIERYTAARMRQIEAEEGLAEAKRLLEERERAARGLAAMGPPPEVKTGFGAPEQFGGYNDMAGRLKEMEEYAFKELNLLAQKQASEEELIAAWHARELEMERQKNEMKLALAQGTFGMMSNMMQNLFVATGSKNKAMFEAMKAFAIAETTIQTYRAAQGAYAALASIPIVGPSLAVAAAAAAVAAGMARVRQISSMQPGGATGTISAGGTATPAYSGGSPSAYPAPQRVETQEKKQEPRIIIYAQGDLIDLSDLSRKVAPYIKEAKGDGLDFGD